MFDKDNKFGFINNDNNNSNNNIEGLDKVKSDINNIKCDLGDEELTTTNKDIKSAINEVNAQYKDIANKFNDKTVDLVMFMGQSNMAGRGVSSESPSVPKGEGFEFRAISNPTKLYDVIEPFGVNENNNNGVSEPNAKTGSLVSAFMNGYYSVTKVPIVGVSCSKGGTSINWWQPGSDALNDAINRHNIAKQWLINNGYRIRHDFMVWCQGETDGDHIMSSVEYTTKIKLMIEEMCTNGIEMCYIIRIGNNKDNATLYNTIINAQTELCKTYKKAVLVSTKFDSMATEGLMKDSFHYKQEGYNITGSDAGKNTGFHIINNIEPYMYDWEHQNMYFPYQNTITDIIIDGNTLQIFNGGNLLKTLVLPVSNNKDDGSIAYTFDNATENGTDFSNAGTISNSKITITTATHIQLSQPISISPDKDFTLEFIHQTTAQYTQGVILSSGDTTGGFINLPNGNTSTGNRLKFRDVNKTFSISWAKNMDIVKNKNHYAIVYDASTKTMKAYENYTEMTDVTIEQGDISKFVGFDFKYIFGGFNADTEYGYIGNVYYIRYSPFVRNTSEMHRE